MFSETRWTMPSKKSSSWKVMVAVMGAFFSFLIRIFSGLDRGESFGLWPRGGEREIHLTTSTSSSESVADLSSELGFCVGRKNVGLEGWGIIVPGFASS